MLVCPRGETGDTAHRTLFHPREGVVPVVEGNRELIISHHQHQVVDMVCTFINWGVVVLLFFVKTILIIERRKATARSLSLASCFTEVRTY